jgi:hypothetical protein
MIKAGRTKDELVRWGGTGVAPKNSFPGSASHDAPDPLRGLAPVGGESFAPSLLPDVPGPLARAVDPVGAGGDLLDPMPTPRPAEWTRPAPSGVRPFDETASYTSPRRNSGDPQPLVGLVPAPDPKLDRTTEYRAPSSTLPMQMTHAESKKWNCDRGNQPWTSDDPAGGPLLGGTRTVADLSTGKSVSKSIGVAVKGVGTGVGSLASGAGSGAGQAIEGVGHAVKRLAELGEEL